MLKILQMKFQQLIIEYGCNLKVELKIVKVFIIICNHCVDQVIYMNYNNRDDGFNKFFAYDDTVIKESVNY